jgi:hypothetical protein
MFENLPKRGAGKSAVAVIALAAPLMAAVPPALAEKTAPAASYDGTWIIDATTSSFFCPVKSKQLVAVVHGGRVMSVTGLPNAKASGAVDRNGAVTMDLQTLGQTARIHGKVQGAAGAGAWTADSFLCSQGSWTAHAER